MACKLNQYSFIRDKIIEELYKNRDIREEFIERLHHDNNRFGVDQLYAYLFYTLCDIEVDSRVAEKHFENIKKHQEELEQTLGREVGFRVSMMDYFYNILPMLKNPKIIEVSTYESKLYLIHVDELTGLYNRRYLEHAVETELQRSMRYNIEFSLMYLDIDDFKAVNDNHGHRVGDSVLKEFASMLKGIIRKEDVAARYGGEEFVILMPQTGTNNAKILADRLLREARNHRFSHNLRITFSGGISSFPKHGVSFEALIERADRGLYMAKMRGKNQVTCLQEKRLDLRYNARLEIIYKHNKHGKDKGVTENLSLGGLAFETDREIKPGKVIEIIIEIPDIGKRYEITAQIVWINEVRPGAKKRIGAKFKNVDYHTLSQLINRLDSN